MLCPLLLPLLLPCIPTELRRPPLLLPTVSSHPLLLSTFCYVSTRPPLLLPLFCCAAQVAAALGYVAHMVDRIASYLDVPLRYPLRPGLSTSLVLDFTPLPVVPAPEEGACHARGAPGSWVGRGSGCPMWRLC